jgi:LuxR family quorum sensing-dependent transcriptional regulator
VRLSSPSRLDAFKSAAQGIVSALAQARDCAELNEIFAPRIERLGYQNAGYLRVFGEGQFHKAKYLFGNAAPGWAERYQSQQYSIDDPVVTAACRLTGAFTLGEVAGPSREGAPILADSRKHGLFDGLVTPIRAEYDEVGLSCWELIISWISLTMSGFFCRVSARPTPALAWRLLPGRRCPSP